MVFKVSPLRRCLLIGNSRWHWAESINSKEFFFHTCSDLANLNEVNDEIFHWAAVGSIPSNSSLDPAKQIFLQDIPLKNVPPWLGIDRALAAWGALRKVDKEGSEFHGLLIADAGTVLSITKLESDREFGGGQLIAGLQLQILAMANGANALGKHRNISTTVDAKIFPSQTAEAMTRGGFQALLGALIEAQRHAQVPLWLCGGDSLVLFDELKQRELPVVWHPNLVMEGMLDIQSVIV